MLWHDYRKSLSVIASVLVELKNLFPIVPLLFDQGLTEDQVAEHISLTKEFAKSLFDIERPPEMNEFIPELIKDCRTGALGTAYHRLVAHSTVKGQRPLLTYSLDKNSVRFDVNNKNACDEAINTYMTAAIANEAKKRKRSGSLDVDDEIRHRPPPPPPPRSSSVQEQQEGPAS